MVDIHPSITKAGIFFLVREYQRLFNNSLHVAVPDFMASRMSDQAEVLERIIRGFQLDPRDYRHGIIEGS